jgi:hypothetical protein
VRALHPLTCHDLALTSCMTAQTLSQRCPPEGGVSYSCAELRPACMHGGERAGATN